VSKATETEIYQHVVIGIAGELYTVFCYVMCIEFEAFVCIFAFKLQ